MKNTLLACSALLLSSTVLAGEDFQHSKRGEFYFGGTAASINVEEYSDPATAIGGTLGVNLMNGKLGTLALDTFFMRTIEEATDNEEFATDVNMAGLFAAYRSKTTIYGKGRVGMVFSELDSSSSEDSDGSGLAVGLGIGAEIFYGVDLELEYTQVFDDQDFEVISINLILGD